MNESEVSLKKIIKKYPVIEVDSITIDKLNSETHQLYDDALKRHDFDECAKLALFPPLFPEYTIQINVGDSVIDYVFVYYEDPEHVFLMYFRGGKKCLAENIDLSAYTPDTFEMYKVSATVISSQIKELASEKQFQLMRMVYLTYCSVSRYMLYYSPELEYVFQNEASNKVKRKYEGRRSIILKSKRRKYIIHKSLPRRDINYHTPSWTVRGHYRRVGKNKTWKYIPPTVAYRKNLTGSHARKQARYTISNGD